MDSSPQKGQKTTQEDQNNFRTMIPTSISRRDDDETIGGFEAESGLRTGLIPGFSVGANETSGGAAGIISSGVSAGEGATAAAAALEAEQRK